ncbi:MAG: GMC family oxidoreductase N-terminal domain-containing protein [Methylobacteriaceae bacterium]|nr:GMC family oxidoreductase N-terminal domain-containing protein [Methylobacteriaceae bacterium]MBV9702920.1 GMC family oxidoreductase N-terminal domain-containing protein [Methylobacteriaceae bacterium]
MAVPKHTFDYIVIGGGSAGCVAAWRLAGEFGSRVLLLEAGCDYKDWILKVPAGFSRILGGTRYLTQHRTVPQEQLGNRVQVIPQAKVLGGGSSINAQAYMRGRAADYDAWGDIAATEQWSWEKMLPHFTRLEGNQKFNNRFHGASGPLKVSDPGFICELSHIYVRALQGMGLPYAPDFNVGAPSGVGYLQMTAARGRRCSAVDAFLRPLSGNAHLLVKTGARVRRILVEKGRAVGVDYVENGRAQVVRTDGEVLLCAGALVSPQILMLSGIGPAERLRTLGIPVIADLPGVGENLKDHCGAPIIAAAPGSYGYFRQDRGLRMIINGLEYLMFKRGRIATNGVEACSFHVPEDGAGDPVIQIYCVPSTSYVEEDVRGVPVVDGVTLHAVLLRPRATGWVRLRSADANDLPLVNPNYLADPNDLRHLRQGVRVARDILEASPLKEIVRGEILPGAHATSDADIDAHIRRTVKTDYHPVGTCRMGRADDPHAVVGSDLRVRGVENLRVIDASIMPRLVSANTNAPTMAIADRGVSLMRGGA